MNTTHSTIDLQSLNEPSDLYRRLFDSSDAHMVVVSSDGVILAINAAWRRFAETNQGGDESAWGVGAHYFTKYDDAWGDTTLAQEAFAGVRQVQQGKLPSFSLEYPCSGPNGEQHWFIVSAFPVQGYAGMVLIAHTNSTGRRQLEDALRLTQFSVNCASDAIFWLKPDARIFDVNPAACRSLGYTREELLQLSVPDIDIQYNTTLWPQHFVELRAQGSLKFESEQRTKDGRCLPVEIVANYVRVGNQEFNCAFVRDISERKRMEQNLRQSETLFRNLFESSAEAIGFSDESGFLDCNEAHVKLFGCAAKEDCLGEYPSRFSPPTQSNGEDSQVLGKKRIDETLRNGSARFEWQHRRLDGSEFWAEVLLTRIDLPEKPMIQGIVRDRAKQP
ncbi:hypothetical protein CCP3SC5AM1_890010 [Gammaproteobacteria bacterium]